MNYVFCIEYKLPLFVPTYLNRLVVPCLFKDAGLRLWNLHTTTSSERQFSFSSHISQTNY